MVIRGRSRGNGKQLANYLLTMGENERIEILDIDRYEDNSEPFLRDTLLSMSLTSELTKSDKGLYHAQINPAYGEDKNMSREDWLKAADMLGEELQLDDQRRVIVLHTKKGRTHAHVVWERYDHDKGIMVSDSFSRLAQDRARKKMEQVFEHKKTPERNPHRPEMKETLSRLWQQSATGKDFIKAAEQEGFTVARGLKRRPFMVIDGNARSFDLVRQLGKEVRTDDVRQKLSGQRIPSEKTALLSVQTRNTMDRTQEAMTDKIAQHLENTAAKAEEQTRQRAAGFAENKTDTTKETVLDKLKRQQQQSSKDMTEPIQPTPEELAEMRRKMIEEQKAMLERQKLNQDPQRKRQRRR